DFRGGSGGRKKIGIDNYVYMLWRYNDCCVRYIPN
ncbi:TraU family protein, partial [Salmonella enterica]